MGFISCYGEEMAAVKTVVRDGLRPYGSESVFRPGHWSLLELTDKAFVKLWQSCASTDEFKERYYALINDLIDDAPGSVTRTFERSLASAKAHVYDYYQPRADRLYHPRDRFEEARSFLEKYDGPEGRDKWAEALRSRHWYQKVHHMQARANRMRAKGVNLRTHARAKVQGTARINYAGLNEYANSFAA